MCALFSWIDESGPQSPLIGFGQSPYRSCDQSGSGTCGEGLVRQGEHTADDHLSHQTAA